MNEPGPPLSSVRLPLLIAGVGLSVALGGCSNGSKGPSVASTPGPHAAPTTAGACNDLPALGGDPGMVIGTDWSGEHHPYGDPVVVYACVTATGGGRVSLVADGTGIRIRPRAVPVDPAGNGLVPFHVTVAEGASGAVRVHQWGGGASNDVEGPVVTGDGDGWHFVPHPW